MLAVLVLALAACADEEPTETVVGATAAETTVTETTVRGDTTASTIAATTTLPPLQTLAYEEVASSDFPIMLTARPGDEVLFFGPGGDYAPRADAGWHLLVGDESALPAIGASLERIPRGAPVRVFIEVSGPEEEQELPTPGDAEIVWLHRGGGPPRGRELRLPRR